MLAMYKAEDFDDAVAKADKLVRDGGIGHTASVYLDEKTQGEKLRAFYEKMKAAASSSILPPRKAESEISITSGSPLP